MVKKIQFWLNNARVVALPQSTMPALTAILMAAGSSEFSLFLSIAALLGVMLAHLSCNLLDDYFDHRNHISGYRDALARAGIRARTAKCPYLVSGEVTPGQLGVCALLAGAALLCGGYILWIRGSQIFFIVLAAGLLGLFYSAKPLCLSYRGLGEPVIGLMFGPLLMAGVSISACGQLKAEVVVVGLAMGMLVTNILYTHSVLDFSADQSVGKKTMAALFSTPRGRLAGSAALTFGPFVLLCIDIAMGTRSPAYLLTLMCLPLAAALYASMAEFCKDPQRPVMRQAWFGPMGKWEAICSQGLDWFLLRWFLSRNLVSLFAGTCILSSLLEEVLSL